MQRQDFGFEVANRYILHMDPAMAGYRVEELPSFYRKLRDGLEAVPGVSRVSFALYSPMEGDNWGETVYIEGQPPPPPGSNENGSSWLRVSDGYFETIGTRIVKGRGITEQDTASSRNVAVVNETFARKFFKDDDPIGKRFGDLDPKYAGNFEIVGVTEDTQYREATRRIPPTFFLPLAQEVGYDEPRFRAFEDRSHYLSAVSILAEGNLPGLEPEVRRATAQVNPDLAVIDFDFRRPGGRDFAQQTMLAKLIALRPPGAGAGLRRPLRRYRLLGRAPHERDRDPHGARRGRVESFEARSAGGVRPDWNRTPYRRSGDHRDGIRDDHAAVRRKALFPGDPSGHDPGLEPGRPGRRARPGPPSGDAVGHSRAANGVTVRLR
jgi:hypothetical protein